MKNLFFLFLVSFSARGISQTYKSVDNGNQIVKRECEIIVVTTDSTTTSNLRKTPGLIEEIPCFTSSTNSLARMFWFYVEFENEVLKGLNYCSTKGN